MTLRQFRRRMGFHLLRLLAAVQARRGMAAVRRSGDRLGRWHHRFAFQQRRSLRRQLERLFDRPAGDPQCRQWLESAYRLSDRAILEVLAMYSGHLTPAEVAEGCEVTGLDVLGKALEQGRGVLLLGWHMGNGVAMATHLAERGYPVSVVHRESNKIQPGFYARGIPRMGLNAIPAQPAAVGVRQMLKTLKGGGIIYILMDQGIKRGVEQRFLNKRMPMPPGPAELARRTGCEVLSARLCGVEPNWRFEIHQEATLDKNEPLEQSVEKLTRIMEAPILEHPEWWSWHQRRWARYPFISD